METLDRKFMALGADNAPGQEARQDNSALETVTRGDKLDGIPVDFSHGDVDAFPPTPGAFDAWQKGYDRGGQQAYTEYRGDGDIRRDVAARLAAFTGAPLASDQELIIAPGTQGALFLALGSVVEDGTKVAVVEPDYFANRKLVRFFNGVVVPIPLDYNEASNNMGPDLAILEQAFETGTRVMVFSTPNNPTGLVYTKSTVERIAELAARYNATVIVDQLYSRLLFDGETYCHLRACPIRPENLITIMGPSKTESLSGFRLGVAFGTPKLIERMEKLQAIVSLRAGGYNQAVLSTWFAEPDGWLAERTAQHQAIRDDLLKVFRDAGLDTATPHGGSYIFPKLPELVVEPDIFVRLLRSQANVTVTPGAEFGLDSTNSIRLNFSQNHDAAVAAAHRIVELVERYHA